MTQFTAEHRALLPGRIRAAFAACLVALVAIASSVVPPTASGAVNSNLGSLALDRHRATIGSKVTVTVEDIDLNATETRSGETVDAGSNPYVIPAGGIGQNFNVTLPTGVLDDTNDDGDINASDVSINITQAKVAGLTLATTTATVTVTRTEAFVADLPYTLAHREYKTASQDPSAIPYILPAGAAGITEFFDLPTVNVFDYDNSGDVSPGDYDLNISDDAMITFVDSSQAVAVVSRLNDIASSTPFTISYRVTTTHTQDSSSNPLVLPATEIVSTYNFFVQHPPIGDANLDGRVDFNDITANGLAASAITFADTDTGLVQVVRSGPLDQDTPFTLSYETALISTATVQVTSNSDETGFALALAETGPATSEFTATFTIADKTSTTNATNPSASTRPAIKVADEGAVIVTYTDQDPLTAVDDTVLIDTVKPAIALEGPPLVDYVFPNDTSVRATVTDVGLGVSPDDIVVHVDLNRNGIFDEAGEVVPGSSATVTTKSAGYAVAIPFPDLGADGETNWYLEVTDRAGNVTRTDSDSEKKNSQNHKVIVDTTQPELLDVYAGESYDEENKKTLLDQPYKARLVFSEPIDADSLVPVNFVIDNLPATETVIHKDLPETVWLTVPGMRSNPKNLQVIRGAGNDKGGLGILSGNYGVIDGLSPNLDISLSRPVTNGEITITITSDENLAAAPSVAIDNQTQGTGTQTGIHEWELILDANAFDELIAGEGIKNVEAAGFDLSGNKGVTGVDALHKDYPDGAIQFEVDTSVSEPLIAPAPSTILPYSDPTIRVSYPGETGEYDGDTWSGVTITYAVLNGIDITEKFTTTTKGAIWEYATEGLERGFYEIEVHAEDMGGNDYPVAKSHFVIDADLAGTTPDPSPLPSPTPTPTATSTPTTEPDPSATTTPGTSATSTAPSEDKSQSTEPTPTATSTRPVPTRPGDTPLTNNEPTEATPTPEPTPAEETGQPSPDPTPAPDASAENLDRVTSQQLPPETPTPTPQPLPTPEPNLPEEDPTPTPTREPEPTPAPVPTPTPEPSPTPIPATPIPEPTPERLADDAANLTDEDVEATAIAMRDQSILEEEQALAAETSSSTSGCSLPLGNTGPNAESALYGAGLLGLIVIARRKREED